jgi:hypothetical protein
MRHRDLAAIAVAATVAATPAVATVMEDLATAPPAAADTSPAGYVQVGQNCRLDSPERQNGPDPGPDFVRTEMSLTSLEGCAVPGTLSLQASGDRSHWKTLAQIHRTDWLFTGVSHQCLSGTSWYQGYFVADDGSFKGGTDSAFPTQFKC